MCKINFEANFSFRSNSRQRLLLDFCFGTHSSFGFFFFFLGNLDIPKDHYMNEKKKTLKGQP
jgi:hypothetical protein